MYVCTYTKIIHYPLRPCAPYYATRRAESALVQLGEPRIIYPGPLSRLSMRRFVITRYAVFRSSSMPRQRRFRQATRPARPSLPFPSPSLLFQVAGPLRTLEYPRN